MITITISTTLVPTAPHLKLTAVAYQARTKRMTLGHHRHCMVVLNMKVK